MAGIKFGPRSENSRRLFRVIETDLEKYTKLPKSVFSEYLASTGKCLYETPLKKETKVRG